MRIDTFHFLKNKGKVQFKTLKESEQVRGAHSRLLV